MLSDGSSEKRGTIKLTKAIIDRITYEKTPTQNAKGKKVCPPEIYWDALLPGFGVRVYESGRKAFVISYRAKGRKHLYCLGQYGILTLDQARDKARIGLAKVLDHGDPLDERLRAQAGTQFKDFACQYIARFAKQHKKTWLEDQRRLTKYLLPKFGSYRLDAISRGEVARFHGELGRQFPYAANRCLEQLSKMFELAKLWGHLPETQVNAARGIQAFREVKRDRWVTPEELPRLAKALSEEANFYGRNAIWLYIEKIWQRIRAKAGVEDCRLHDLRRTVGSWLAQSGNSLHLIGRVLNHSSQSTTAIYARFGQDNVRQAMERHGNQIMAIAGNQAPQKTFNKTR